MLIAKTPSLVPSGIIIDKIEYKKAEEQVTFFLKQYNSDRLYLLFAMIYESLGKNKPAKQQYLKLISQFPDSDYFISAKIKSKILGQH